MAFDHQATDTGTDQDLLDNVRAMIARVTANGQEYRDTAGFMVKLPDLSDLVAQEEMLKARIDQAASGPARNLVELRRFPT